MEIWWRKRDKGPSASAGHGLGCFRVLAQSPALNDPASHTPLPPSATTSTVGQPLESGVG